MEAINVRDFLQMSVMGFTVGSRFLTVEVRELMLTVKLKTYSCWVGKQSYHRVVVVPTVVPGRASELDNVAEYLPPEKQGMTQEHKLCVRPPGMLGLGFISTALFHSLLL